MTNLLVFHDSVPYPVQMPSVATPNLLVNVRGRLRQSQEEFAKNLGISRPYLSKLENASGTLSSKLASRLKDLCRNNGLESIVGVSTSARNVPVRSWARAGVGIDYDELALDWQKQVATDCPDAKAFAVEIQGDSMEPKFLQGDLAVLMPERRPRNGNIVVARLESEGVIFKVFTSRIEVNQQVCTFTSYNQVFQPIIVPASSIIWNFPVYQIIRQVWCQ